MTDDGVASRISNGPRELLSGLAKPLRTDVMSKDGLIVPVTTFTEISYKNEKADQSLKLLREQLESADLTQLPIIVQTPAADFTLLPTSQPESYPGVITTPMFPVPEKQLIQKMIGDVEMKAKKRESWKGERRRCPYVVALTEEFAWTDYNMAKSAFLGDVTVEVAGPWSNPLLTQECQLRRKTAGTSTSRRNASFLMRKRGAICCLEKRAPSSPARL
jgi:hypothetical protein